MNKKDRKRKKQRLEKETQRLTGRVKVDERFTSGPFEVVRAGKLVVMKNNSTPEQHTENLKRIAKINKELFLEMELKIKELQEEISKYDPLEIMQFAGYKAISLLMHGKTESELDHDESKVLPSIEYLQYLIARTPVKEGYTKPSDESLIDIWVRTVAILDTTLNYLMTRPTKEKPPSKTDELVQMVDQMRLMVRVMRFPNYQVDHWKESLEPYDNLLKKAYGVGAVEIIEGLKQLSEHQKRGIMQKHFDAKEAVSRLRTRAQDLGLEEGDAKVYRDEIEKSEELTALNEDVEQKLTEAWTIRLFDITDVSTLPKPVLSLLSVKPGVNPLEKLTGDNFEDLSPLSTDVEHYKPFLRVDDKFYTFYHAGFEDRIAEIIEDDLNKKYPKQRPSIEKARSDYIEIEAVELLSSILKPDYKAISLYYPNPDEEGHFTELDGLIEVDDTLVLVEVKSGGISAGMARGAPSSIEHDLKGLIFEGQRQSERAERYIKSAEKVEFFDSTHKNVLHTLEHKNYRKIIRVVVSRESLGWIGASLVKLAVLDPTLSENMPWQISVDDLRAVSELFENKSIEFGHYLQVRLEAAENLTLSQNDEIDHVALYNAMNYYHNNVEQGATRTTFNAYSLPIDRYFMDKLGGDDPEKPEQQIPNELRLIINALEESRLKHRFEVGAFLLSNDSNQRKGITKHLRKVIGQNEGDRRRVIRVGSPDQKTGYSFGHTEEANLEMEKLRCAGYMKNMGLDRWLIANIDTGKKLIIRDIIEIGIDDFTEDQISDAQAEIESRMKQKLSGLNIAKNQQCPCGSGERYKNCHGKKHG